MRGEYRRDALEHTDELRFRSQQEKHELSELYKAKIRNMSNAGRNGGEYYTTPCPLLRFRLQSLRSVKRFMKVRVALVGS